MIVGERHLEIPFSVILRPSALENLALYFSRQHTAVPIILDFHKVCICGYVGDLKK